MGTRRRIRGGRRPIVIDLVIFVALAALLMAGFRATQEGEIDGPGRLAATLALLGMPALAAMYGAAAAVELRRGWLGASIATGLLHAGLVLGSLAGVVVLAALSPPAAVLAIAAEGGLLLWSSSWP